ncbi:diacylglycerol kinase [Mycobacterium mantenii]|uniref:Diacylglycerol kinase n=1 Tax=Mycobacterium mantenii TaxID=560555 RepID=A0A1X0FT64_MYCNT|nr:dihydrodipicolinate reductase [Mycobacterium mantenii]BBY38132.1 diacylglycerol kinase [Mycobacterium mantenii]
MIHRVAAFSTGTIGKLAIRTISRRADLELVGLWVHSPEKVGQDAGVLAGIDPVGITATNDIDELLALEPDCICFSAADPNRDAVVPTLVRILESGINVVAVSIPALVYPPGYRSDLRAQLQAAAEHGGATLYVSGIEPGFAGDHLPLTLLTMSDTIRSVRAQEMLRYDTYPVRYVMFEGMGFGMPMDYKPLASASGVNTITWGPLLRMIADRLEVEIDAIRETYDKVVTPRTLEVAAGTIEAGTVGAVRFETIAVVGGRDAIVIEHVNRMAGDLAPEWPSADRDGVYRVMIEGNPDLKCELTVGRPDTACDDTLVATTMRIVNAIPFVCDAPAGLVSSLDLPLTTPRCSFV